MPKIVFLCDHTVKDMTGTSYTEGEELECSDASAGHFIRRRLAKLVEPPKAVKPKAKPKPKDKSDGEQGQPDAG